MCVQSPVRVSASLPVREWLQSLEEQMRSSLATQLQAAVDGKDQDFADWVQHYPTQVSHASPHLLASQVLCVVCAPPAPPRRCLLTCVVVRVHGLRLCQVVILAVQIWWSSGVEASLSSTSLPAGSQRLQAPLDGLTARLLTSVQRVLTDANTQVRHLPLFDRCLPPLTDAPESRHDVSCV